jgi:hypothetical protein
MKQRKERERKNKNKKGVKTKGRMSIFIFKEKIRDSSVSSSDLLSANQNHFTVPQEGSVTRATVDIAASEIMMYLRCGAMQMLYYFLYGN